MKTPPRATLRWLATGMLLASLTTGCLNDGTPTVQAFVPSTAAPVYDFIRIAPLGPTQPPQPTLRPKVVPVVTPRPTAAPRASKSPASVSGTATYYCCTAHYPSGLYAAAGSEIRIGAWRGRYVSVCGQVCVRVRLIDWCGCPGKRIIDLYPEVFRRLAPLSRGIVPVTVKW